MKELREVVIVDGCRTAVGSMGGALKPLHALDLATCVLQGTLDRTGLDPKEVDEVILEVWNSIENYFSDYSGEKKLKACRDYGLIYYYRSGEKAD